MSSAEKFSSAAFAELLNVQAECANQIALVLKVLNINAEPAE